MPFQSQRQISKKDQALRVEAARERLADQSIIDLPKTQPNQASPSADQTLSNIDNALAENDASPDPASSSATSPNPASDSGSSPAPSGSSAPNRSANRFRDNQHTKAAPQRQTTRRTPDAAKTPAKPSTPMNAAGHAPTPRGAATTAASGVGGGIVGGLMRKYGAAKTYVGQNRKGFLVGGGITGLIATLVMSFFALLPLKIEAMVKAIYGHEYARVEHAMERRVERIFIKYAMQRTLNSSGGIVAEGNPLGDLYKTWRVQQAEGKFFEQEGLKIEQGSTSRSIKVTFATDAREFSSESEFADYLDRDLKGRQARAFINKVARDQTKWYQIIKRRHLRRWWRIAYGIKGWRFWEKKTEDPKAADTEFDKNLGTSLNDSVKPKIAEGIECAGSGTNCPDSTDKSEIKAIDETTEGKQVADAAGEALDTTAEEATSKTFAKIVGEKLVKVASSKLIPVIGWIDFGARLDDFLWNDRAWTVVQSIRRAAYASTFITWLKISDQIKDGSISAAQVNSALKKLDTMEQSHAFQKLFMNNDGGQKIPSLQLMGKPNIVQYFSTGTKAILLIEHYPLQVYLKLGAPILDAAGGAINWLVERIPGVTELEDWVAKYFVKMLVYLYTPPIVKKDDGAAQMNAADVGGDVSANEFAEDQLGAPPISAQAAAKVQDSIAADRHATNPSLAERLWSLGDPSSLVSRLAVALPTSPTTAVRNGFSHLLATLANPLNLGTNTLQFAFNTNTSSSWAAGTIDEYGVEQFGYTDADASSPIDDAQIHALDQAKQKAAEDNRTIDQIVPEDCPDVPKGQPNLCKLNIVAIQSLKARFTGTDNGGFNSSGGK